MGLIHELGHGMYEQNVDLKYLPLGLMGGVSLGIHESQSRFLENVVGRSTEFWQYFLPKLQSALPEFQDVQLSELVTALNEVQPSLIRTEADEITYNLHILLRFELEVALISGELKVADLPEAWRAKMQELLGVTPTGDAEGVLQDVHWAWGNFGYFPTYTLGNLNAAQLLESFTKAQPNWITEVAQGNFEAYRNWFKEKIWQHGCLFTPAELMKNATGETTQSTYLLRYLRKKYLGS
jgi:carboxypeptidase Taq